MSELDAYMAFVDRAHAMAAARGRTTINWQEVWEGRNNERSGLDKSVVVHIWKGFEPVVNVTRAITQQGYRFAV